MEKTKKELLSILAGLSCITIIYFAFSFYYLSINAGEWSADARFYFIIGALMLGFGVYAATKNI